MKKGFTLIELLIVISIIGILAVALLPNILSAPATARDAGRKAALNNVLSALEQYKAANGEYPKWSTRGTAVGLSTAGVDSYFKGGAVPEGAEVPTGGETEVLGTAPAAGATDVIYCPLKANDGGYSYAVAIRMEQPQGGDNGLKTVAAANCDGFDGADVPVDYFGGGSSNWYYLVQ